MWDLLVTRPGFGTGVVTSMPVGIDCGMNCQHAFADGSTVLLTAVADASSDFLGWSAGSGCPGTGQCSVRMTGPATIRATFALKSWRLTVAVNGPGGVTSMPNGINCGLNCSMMYDHGTQVTLTPTPLPGSSFLGWTGDCTGAGACVVPMTAAKSVFAQFSVPLTVSTVGQGTVTSMPGGINCGANCSQQFPPGTMVTLTATPAASAVFVRWDGACAGNMPTCAVNMDVARTVTATFGVKMLTLTVQKQGTGEGVVTDTSSGTLNCGSVCSEPVPWGTTVRLSGTPSTAVATLSNFSWVGACAAAGSGDCALTILADTVVTADFSLKPNLVFITSGTFTGNLGGTAGANTICQTAARNVLPGTYRAWISTTSTPAVSQLGAASGWVRADGRPVANSAADFSAGRHLYPVRFNDLGAEAGPTTTIMTGTLNGRASGFHCNNFGGTTGLASGGTSRAEGDLFTDGYNTNCATAAPIYCLGIDRAATVAAAPPTPLRRAFVSQAEWTPGGGLASADSFCQAEAQTARLTGTFLALLARGPQGTIAGGSMESRFDATGAPWVRVDGVQLTRTAAELFTVPYWDAPLIVSANGSFVTGSSAAVWSGAYTRQAAGTAEATCNNWATANQSFTGLAGNPGWSFVDWIIGGAGLIPCLQAHVYCLEQ